MKIITTEVLLSQGIDVPVITRTYDTLSKKCDGTITSQAPLVVSGENLNLFNSAEMQLCLAPAVDYFRVIEVHTVYEYTSERVIVSLPVLQPGEYFPAIKVLCQKQSPIYIFPVSWVVLPKNSEIKKEILRYAETRK